MLQIDLPMPEACDVCQFNYDFCWCSAFKDNEFDKYSDDWNKQVCDGEHRPEYCPLEEVPQIVRCKDCIHGEKPPTFRYYPNLTWCNKYKLSHDDNWFCADGEKRDES